jgi:Flp pilus assembly protein TadG
VDGGLVVKRRRQGRRRQYEGGAVAVEFALVLPLLIGLIMGTIDWGYYFFVSEVVGNAAREGARAGSVMRGSPADIAANICLATGPVRVGVVDYLRRGRLIVDAADTRLKAFDCTNPLFSCCELVTVTTTNDAVRVRVAYQTKPAGTGSMSITGMLPTSLLPSTAATVATMRLEP